MEVRVAVARLTAAGSLAIAVVLAVLVPSVDGAGVASLIGWTGVVALGIGLVAGKPVGLTIAGASFVVRVGLVAAIDGPLAPPVWMQAFLLVVSIELAAVSLQQRTRPRAPVVALGRAGLSGIVALLTALVLEAAVYGATAEGLLLRVGAVASLVLVAGWVSQIWRRAVE
jgi:hypothetical protein